MHFANFAVTVMSVLWNKKKQKVRNVIKHTFKDSLLFPQAGNERVYNFILECNLMQLTKTASKLYNMSRTPVNVTGKKNQASDR